jgi:hypothetical protein
MDKRQAVMELNDIIRSIEYDMRKNLAIIKLKVSDYGYKCKDIAWNSYFIDWGNEQNDGWILLHDYRKSKIVKHLKMLKDLIIKDSRTTIKAIEIKIAKPQYDNRILQQINSGDRAIVYG